MLFKYMLQKINFLEVFILNVAIFVINRGRINDYQNFVISDID